MKKLLSIVMAAALTLTLSVGALAASPGTPSDIDTTNFQAALKANGANSLILLDKKAIALDSLSTLNPTPDTELKLYITDTMFIDNTSARINADLTKPKHMSRAQIRTSKLALRRSTSRGSKAFASVGLAYDKVGSYISVKFVDTFVSVDDLDFSTTLYLTIDGTRKKGTEITIAGTMTADTIEVYADDDYIDISDGSVAEAVERVSKVELDLGNSVTIFTPLVKGKRYYGVCNTDYTNSDISLMTKYPGINEVYYLKTLNIKVSSQSVSIYTAGKMYAYGADGVYLGTTDKLLPFSSKYYVSDIKYKSLAVK